MPITPSIDQSTVFIACLGNGDDSNRWLNGSTDDGSVAVTYRLPSVGVNLSGTLWKAAAVSGSTNTYTFQSLGSNANVSHVYLDGSPDGSVSLDSDNTAQSAQWQLQVVGSPADFYPQQPWQGTVAHSYTFQLRNVHTSTYLNGVTNNGAVGLTSDTSQTGTNWLVLVAAGS